ncbi:PmoA family protein [Crateriforma spongiae]|uniref:DUF6807 domain-containing protein n=1 Tax=Crateriforma spongiae TaxID=2724528 RepID=UPI0039AF088E
MFTPITPSSVTRYSHNVGTALILLSLSAGLSITGQPILFGQGVSQDAFQWQRTETTLSLNADDETVWKFCWGSDASKPYFHPIAVGGRTLTWNQPADHIWHHGLWFSWKYINGVNYWELDRESGLPAGRTAWESPDVETHNDGSATIRMQLRYQQGDALVTVLTEDRKIHVSAPSADGSFTIDWQSTFRATIDVTLDRTPPQKNYGGYAGLSVRFAKDLTNRNAIGVAGPLKFDDGNRHRGHGKAVDYQGTIDGTAVGLAVLDHPDNPRHPTPWYIVRSGQMGYINASLLHDSPLKMKKGEHLTFRYRLIAHLENWTDGQLRAACDQWR